MRFIDEAVVASVLRMQDLIPIMRRTMIDFSEGRINQATRKIFPVPPHSGFFGSMPAAGSDMLGAKLLTVYPENGAKGLHTHMALIALFCPETGEPLAIMDGRLITEMRTAAVSAAFVDAVANPGVSTLAILGAGTQARSHIEALSLVRSFTEIRIWNRTPARAERLANAVGGSVMSCEEAVRGADVVVVATSSKEPVFRGEWLRSGAKVVSVGWSGADGAELDAVALSQQLIVDSRAGALTESGNVLRFNPLIYAELGELLSGSRPVDSEATVVFDSIGMACQDVAAAALVYSKLDC